MYAELQQQIIDITCAQRLSTVKKQLTIILSRLKLQDLKIVTYPRLHIYAS